METPLDQALYAEPYRFSFFQAVRLLERLAPERRPVGRTAKPGREVARFHAHASLAFPPSEIQGLIAPPEGAGPPDMTVAFLGLFGPSGVLPTVYTELVIDRLRKGDRTLAAFLDLFHHRMISFFYRAWEKYRPPILHERGDDVPFAHWLHSLMGLGIGPLRDRHLALPDAALLPFAGAYARVPRPALVLESVLSEYFQRSIEVEPFIGRWLRLGLEDQSTLGARGQHNQLGASVVVGARSWDETSQFRLRVGPLNYAQFQEFLPGGRAHQALCEQARLFVGAEFDFDIQLVLRAGDVPPCPLGGQEAGGVRLGRSTWLTSRPPARDVEDAIFMAP